MRGEAKKLLQDQVGAPHLIALVKEMEDCCQVALQRLGSANVDEFLIRQGEFKGWAAATKFVKGLITDATQARESGERFMGHA